jgi:ADP-heptose:LPS heptosyltransferase
MNKILIHPWSTRLSSGKNPKNYPHWEEVADILMEEGHIVLQLGLSGEPPISERVGIIQNQSFEQIVELLRECTVVCVDSFLPHLAHHHGIGGLNVIFSQSDPEIFGHAENNNILRHRKFLRPNQYAKWEQATYDEGAFLGPVELVRRLVIKDKTQTT